MIACFYNNKFFIDLYFLWTKNSENDFNLFFVIGA